MVAGSEIIGAAIEVHKVLGGPGLLESVYEASLCYELIQREFDVRDKPERLKLQQPGTAPQV